MSTPVSDRWIRGSIVVGVETVGRAHAAVRWALTVARQTHRPVTLFHVAPSGEFAEDSAARIGDIFDQHLRMAPVYPDEPEIRRLVVSGDAITELGRRTSGAAMLVIGHRSLTNLRGTSSRGIAIARHVDVPLVSVPEDWEPSGERQDVVLGVSCSPAGTDAVDFAFQCASVWRAPLRAVHTWELHDIPRYTEALEAFERGAEEEPVCFSEAMCGWREKYSDVVVNSELQRGPAVDVLLDGSRTAQLLVLGGPETGQPHPENDNVLRTVLRHAHCPVAIVRHQAAAWTS